MTARIVYGLRTAAAWPFFALALLFMLPVLAFSRIATWIERGSTKDVEGHHDDYTLPYSVRWLCTIHHTALHRSAPDQPALQPAS